MIRTIMGCGQSWLATLEDLSYVGLRDPDADAPHPVELEGVARRILAIYPELKPVYDSWWADQRLEAAFAIATEKSLWWMVSGHLRDVSPFMIATHERNLDEDAAGVAELEHTPKTSDVLESTFAVLDRTLVLGANTHALFGVAHAQLIKGFDTAPAKKQRAKETVAQKMRRGASDGGSDEVDAQVAAWDITSYFSLSRKKWWGLVKDVRRHYDDLCVLAPKEKRKEHDAAKLERLKAARAAEITRC